MDPSVYQQQQSNGWQNDRNGAGSRSMMMEDTNANGATYYQPNQPQMSQDMYQGYSNGDGWASDRKGGGAQSLMYEDTGGGWG